MKKSVLGVLASTLVAGVLSASDINDTLPLDVAIKESNQTVIGQVKSGAKSLAGEAADAGKTAVSSILSFSKSTYGDAKALINGEANQTEEENATVADANQTSFADRVKADVKELAGEAVDQSKSVYASVVAYSKKKYAQAKAAICDDRNETNSTVVAAEEDNASKTESNTSIVERIKAKTEVLKHEASDVSIHTSIKYKFLRSSDVRSMKIKVKVVDGNVTLSGNAKDAKEIDTAMKLAREVDGVVGVSFQGTIGQ